MNLKYFYYFCFDFFNEGNRYILPHLNKLYSLLILFGNYSLTNPVTSLKIKQMRFIH